MRQVRSRTAQVPLASCISATRLRACRLYSGRHSRSIPTTLSVMLVLMASRAPACRYQSLRITDRWDNIWACQQTSPNFGANCKERYTVVFTPSLPMRRPRGLELMARTHDTWTLTIPVTSKDAHQQSVQACLMVGARCMLQASSPCTWQASSTTYTVKPPEKSNGAGAAMP